MYIIISHDVDHLFGKEHWLRDMIYPKLVLRTSLQLIRRDITIKEWYLRIFSCFRKKRNCIQELMQFDKEYNVDSTFFFGMNQGLGMSYRPDEAKKIIHEVYMCGFEVGVHGVVYDNQAGIKKEYEQFRNTVGFVPNGIRMHYVRFDEGTFEMLADTGYLFDSTEFDKKRCGTIKAPYKVGSMWEFPLTIMDGYLPQKADEAKRRTIEILEKCYDLRLEYVSILFHDYQFCDAYKDMHEWYRWLIEYVSNDEKYNFISYIDAIERLEKEGK